MLIISVQARAYGMGIYAIMLPSGVFSVAHWKERTPLQLREYPYACYQKFNCVTQDALFWLLLFILIYSYN